MECFQGIKQLIGARSYFTNDLLWKTNFPHFLGTPSARPHQKLQLRVFINFYLINGNFKTLSKCTFLGGSTRLKVVTVQWTKIKCSVLNKLKSTELISCEEFINPSIVSKSNSRKNRIINSFGLFFFICVFMSYSNSKTGFGNDVSQRRQSCLF